MHTPHSTYVRMYAYIYHNIYYHDLLTRFNQFSVTADWLEDWSDTTIEGVVGSVRSHVDQHTYVCITLQSSYYIELVIAT